MKLKQDRMLRYIKYKVRFLHMTMTTKSLRIKWKIYCENTNEFNIILVKKGVICVFLTCKLKKKEESWNHSY